MSRLFAQNGNKLGMVSKLAEAKDDRIDFRLHELESVEIPFERRCRDSNFSTNQECSSNPKCCPIIEYYSSIN